MLREMFKGRLTRSNFLLGFVYYFISLFALLLALGIILSLPLTLISGGNKYAVIAPLTALAIMWYIAMSICVVSLVVRRLHDLNRGGATALLILIPFVNFAFSIYLLVAPGSFSANQFGAVDTSRDFKNITKFRK